MRFAALPRLGQAARQLLTDSLAAHGTWPRRRGSARQPVHQGTGGHRPGRPWSVFKSPPPTHLYAELRRALGSGTWCGFPPGTTRPSCVSAVLSVSLHLCDPFRRRRDGLALVEKGSVALESLIAGWDLFAQRSLTVVLRGSDPSDPARTWQVWRRAAPRPARRSRRRA